MVRQAPSRAVPRAKALNPWIERLRWQCEHRESPGDLELHFEGETLLLESWAVGKVLEDSDSSELVAQGIALQMKTAVDRSQLHRARSSPGQKVYELQAHMMLNTAMGMALIREVQHRIDDEVRQGGMASAKDWSRFKQTLVAAVTEVKKRLADSERSRAERISDELTDRPREQAEEPASYSRMMQQLDTEERRRKHLARARKRAREALDHLPSRTELLMAAVVVAVVVWLGFVQLPGQLDFEPHVLSLEDFPTSEGFVELRANPPSLYLTIDEEFWSGLGLEQRQHLVRTTSGVLLARGYSGALIRTAGGRPVAQWLVHNGVTLLETNEVRQAPETVAP
jgi:hypothetical protein